jgi:hypothetical protein
MTYLKWLILLLNATLLLGTEVCAQLRNIDPAKLPQDERIQTAYSSLLPIEPMVRGWTNSWTYDTPKQQVVALLTSSLHDLRSAEATAPQNEELFLLTGLVAHLAYNVDSEGVYETAVQSLEKAHNLAPGDYRAEWFLGAHLCQANEIKTGMEQFLAVEDHMAWQQLPIDFWDDYMSCSTISLMPAHTLRAVDRAVHLGASPSSYSSTVDLAHKRYKPTEADTTYPSHEAWQANEENGTVLFTSELCGTGYSAHSDWHLEISDVAKGICTSQIETGPYPSKSGKSSPTLLVLTRMPKAQETLDDFVHSFLKGRYASAIPATAASCPADKCLAFEIVTKTPYESEGGAHFLVEAFAAQPPDFPGLLFERPDAPPKAKPGDKTTYYHPNEKLHRFPGTLYSIVLLDSNNSIFEKAKDDFAYLLKSMQLD